MSFDIVDISHTITGKQPNKKKAVDIPETIQTRWKYI